MSTTKTKAKTATLRPSAKSPAVKQLALKKKSAKLPLEAALLKQLFTLMVKSRVLEERLIKIYKVGESFFWIGAPGEEAFGVALGLNVNKGQGLDFDYLHLHYRCT